MEDLRKMLLAMAKDIGVMLIKLADRLHTRAHRASTSPRRKQRDKARGNHGDLCADSRTGWV